MTPRFTLGRLTTWLGHDLSPMPIFTVCLGYWWPLEWMLRGEALLKSMTLVEKLHTLASSFVIYFASTAMALSLLVYLSATLVLLTRVSYRKAVSVGLNLVANLLFVAVTAKTLKLLVLGALTTPNWIRILSLGAIILSGLWLTTRGIWSARYLIVPRGIALFSLPLAIGLVSAEAMQHAGIRAPAPSSIQFHPGGSRPPDIILVTLDALSARHMSCYDYVRATTPHIDAFAKEAITFDSFYANANWTRPGTASLLNGCRPWTHNGDTGRPTRSVTIPQNLLGCLVRSGYDVRTVSANPLADHFWQGTPVRCAESRLDGCGIGQGFFGPFILTISSTIAACNIGPAPYLRLILHQLLPPLPQDRINIPLAHAEKMLGQAPRDRPLFFWLHLFCPHDPYTAPKPFFGRFEPAPHAPISQETPITGFGAWRDPECQRILTARYDESILVADAAVGQLLGWLKDHGRYEHSIVVVSADHGESFSHDYGSHGGPLLSEELVNVPCLIKRMDQRTPERVEQLFEQADLAPTLLHMAGLPIPAGMEGQPYPLKAEGAPVFSMNHDLQTRKHTFSIAMRQGAWKYVDHFGPWVHPWPQQELYNLDQDPGEITNLVNQRSEIAAPMHQRILEELAKRGLKPEAP